MELLSFEIACLCRGVALTAMSLEVALAKMLYDAKLEMQLFHSTEVVGFIWS
jgi:hypothetical protein